MFSIFLPVTSSYSRSENQTPVCSGSCLGISTYPFTFLGLDSPPVWKESLTSCLPLPAFWDCLTVRTQMPMSHDVFLSYFQPGANEGGRRSEVWENSNLNKESGASLVLHFCFPASFLLLAPLSELAFFTSDSLQVRLLPILYCIALREAKERFVEREMDSLRCTIRNGCLPGPPAHSNDPSGKVPAPHLTGAPCQLS